MLSTLLNAECHLNIVNAKTKERHDTNSATFNTNNNTRLEL